MSEISEQDEKELQSLADYLVGLVMKERAKEKDKGRD